MHRWTMAWVMSLFMLIMANALIISPLVAVSDGSTSFDPETDLTGNTTARCVQADSGNTNQLVSVVTKVVLAPVVGAVQLAVWISSLLFGDIEDPPVEDCPSGAIVDSIDFFGGNGAIFLVGGTLVVLGGSVLLSGFVTGGASRGGIATVGYALIIGGAVGVGLSIVEPALSMLHWSVFAIYSGIGLFLVINDGLDMLAGRGS